MSTRSHLATLAIVVALAASSAAAQTSLNVELLSHQDLYGAYASCIGWTSPGGAEFAIIGTDGGTSIVDVSDAENPSEKAFIPGVSSSWREMKTYSHYAYIVTEGAGGGMQIVDLATSPPSLVATYLTTFNTAHTITIVDGYAYVNGARMNGTQVGIRILNLANPVAPVDVGGWNAFYTHDCQVRGNRLWAACISNGLLAIVDITNKAAPVTLKTFTWPGNVAHNCDLTTDGRYLLTTDETPMGHLHVFDVSDIMNPVLVKEWTANPAGIIHNVHIKDNLAYIAYYTEGLRVLDITDPVHPVEVGYYDTWPGASGGYNGNWAVYPYTASGNAYLSDISTGLYVVKFEQTTGSASGIVRQSGGGPVLPGAQVHFTSGPATVTDGTGYYKLFDVPGTHTVVTELFGYEPDSTDVVLTLGQDTPQDIELVALAGSTLNGNVADFNTASPLASASVVLEDTPLNVLSNGSGHYDFSSIPYGVYGVTASRFGYEPLHRTVTISMQGPSSLDFALQPAPLVADFEANNAGWARVASTATSGLWIWADPVGSGSGLVQPENDHSSAPGVRCWVTGNSASPADAIGNADVDNGSTILQTPVFSMLGMTNPAVSYWRWFSNDAGSAPGEDTLKVDISNNGGTTWKRLESQLQSQAAWTQVTKLVAPVVAPTANMRVRFIAEDQNPGSVVEAAIDDFMAYDAQPTATQSVPHANRLYPNVPNPFNPTTRLRFELATSAVARLRIFDPQGRLVRELAGGVLAAGPHERIWDGRDALGRRVASGAYFVKLDTPSFSTSQRVVLVK